MTDNDAGTQRALTLVPAALAFEDVGVGGERRRSIRLTNTGDVAISIEVEPLQSNTFQTEFGPEASLAPGSSIDLLVIARPPSEGRVEETLRLQGGDVRYDVPLSIHARPVLDCDDQNSCTEDNYNPERYTCEHRMLSGNACSSDACTVGTCAAGACVAEPRACEDGLMCTVDQCDPEAGGCVFTPQDDACQTDDPCSPLRCDAQLGCVADAPLPDNTACTTATLGACRIGACSGGRCIDAGPADMGSPCPFDNPDGPKTYCEETARCLAAAEAVVYDANGRPILASDVGDVLPNDIVCGFPNQDTPLCPQVRPFQGFVTTWDTQAPGVSNDTSIQIRVGDGLFLYDVDWNNDGIFDTFDLTGNVTHDFGQPGVYTIAIRGLFPHIQLSGPPQSSNDPREERTAAEVGDAPKLLSIDAWGDIAWESMENAFAGCTRMQLLATDQPDLRRVQSLEGMFMAALRLNAEVNHWDTSAVTNMRRTFAWANAFDLPLEAWNTENVRDMSQMFIEADAFNQPLEAWNVSNVRDMSEMFRDADGFDQPLAAWNTSRVTTTKWMFRAADTFNQPLDAWDTSSVTTMRRMFALTEAFNQPLDTWNTSNTTDMSHMFERA
ncbi:MAG: BspA family leucine-rich repeat surface protein, partial [Myxococcota bacterium]